jgi:hypothetical protein
MHTNDGKYFKLKALGYTGESLPDLTKEWLIDLDAIGTSIPDLERSYLTTAGYSGTIDDMWFAWLAAQGATGGSLADRWHDYWTTGTFTQTISVDGDDSLQRGSTWTIEGIWGSLIFGRFNTHSDSWSMMSFSTGGAIPRSATVQSATLTVEKGTTFGSDINFNVGCQKVATAVQPSASNNPNAVTWTMTTARTNRTDAPAAGLVDIDITSSIQEIVNQSGWDKGRINVFTEDNHSSGTDNQSWAVKDESTDGAPSKLTVTWEK